MYVFDLTSARGPLAAGPTLALASNQPGTSDERQQGGTRRSILEEDNVCLFKQKPVLPQSADTLQCQIKNEI